jgi:hypothetical protein
VKSPERHGSRRSKGRQALFVGAPVPALHPDLRLLQNETMVAIAILFGAMFGMVALRSSS